MTVQLAAWGGARAVAVTTSSAERGERLRKLGATHVLDRVGDGARGVTTSSLMSLLVLTCRLSSTSSTRTDAW
jgi:NADPH:quinone reductase-like Zn-dependent oxidoreductase